MTPTMNADCHSPDYVDPEGRRVVPPRRPRPPGRHGLGPNERITDKDAAMVYEDLSQHPDKWVRDVVEDWMRARDEGDALRALLGRCAMALERLGIEQCGCCEGSGRAETVTADCGVCHGAGLVSIPRDDLGLAFAVETIAALRSAGVEPTP